MSQDSSCSGAVSDIFQEIPAPSLSPPSVFYCSREDWQRKGDLAHLKLHRTAVIWHWEAQQLLAPCAHQATSALTAPFCKLLRKITLNWLFLPSSQHRVLFTAHPAAATHVVHSHWAETSTATAPLTSGSSCQLCVCTPFNMGIVSTEH